METDRQTMIASHGVVSGIVASVFALAYWVFALHIKTDSALGIGTLGNIKCYVLFVCVFMVGFCICYGIMSKYNIKIVNNIWLNYGVGVGTLVLIGTSYEPFLKEAWVFPTAVTVVVGGGVASLMLKEYS